MKSMALLFQNYHLRNKRRGTRRQTPSHDSDSNQTKEQWCFCDTHDDASLPMVQCSSSTCSVLWFHFDCVGIDDESSLPEQWLCPSCRRYDGQSVYLMPSTHNFYAGRSTLWYNEELPVRQLKMESRANGYRAWRLHFYFAPRVLKRSPEKIRANLSLVDENNEAITMCGLFLVKNFASWEGGGKVTFEVRHDTQMSSIVMKARDIRAKLIRRDPQSVTHRHLVKMVVNLNWSRKRIKIPFFRSEMSGLQFHNKVHGIPRSREPSPQWHVYVEANEDKQQQQEQEAQQTLEDSQPQPKREIKRERKRKRESSPNLEPVEHVCVAPIMQIEEPQVDLSQETCETEEQCIGEPQSVTLLSESPDDDDDDTIYGSEHGNSRQLYSQHDFDGCSGSSPIVNISHYSRWKSPNRTSAIFSLFNKYHAELSSSLDNHHTSSLPMITQIPSPMVL